MRRIRNRRNKNKNKYMVLGAFALLFVFSVGYAAFTTNVTLNMKGNVQSLSAAELLRKKKVTTGDGLYQEGTRYVFKGAEPANYIQFNGEVWRIMSVEADDTLKIIKDEKLDTSMKFDENDSHRKSGYCANKTYCNAWASSYTPSGDFVNGTVSGSVSGDATLKTYLNGDYYNNVLGANSNIASGSFSIGGASNYNDSNTVVQLRSMEDSFKWTGYVALATKSEYINANTNSSCLTASALYSNYETCKTTNYLIKTYSWWLLSPWTDMDGVVLVASINGLQNSHYAASADGVRPVLYLKSDIKLTGKGTSSNMYKIVGDNQSGGVVPGSLADATFAKLDQPYVASGDGAYKEGDRYVFKGADPWNYILFNNEIWRIMSIESDGTLKIIRDEKLDTDMAFDADDSHRKSGYCSRYSECNAWVSTANMVGSPAQFTNGSATSGAVSDDSTLKKYLNTTYLSSITTNSDKIVEGTFNIGASGNSNDTNSISQLQALEDDYQWTGSVGLATKSEYMNANTNSSCLTASLHYSNSSTCKTTNYLFKTFYWWLLSPYSGDYYTSDVFNVYNGSIGGRSAYVPIGVRPVLYLSSNINLTGTGVNMNHPYIIS